jgi:hypothetical protein
MAPYVSRHPPHRKRKTRVLVIGQGRETEPNYFRGLRQDPIVHQRFVVKVVPGKGETPLEAVRKAITISAAAKRIGKDEEYDLVLCVLDVEPLGQNPQLAEARELAKQAGIRVALSNPAFEVWVLAHFTRTCRSFADCDKVVEEIRKHWPEYAKNDENIFDRLRKRTVAAIENARQVREVDFKNVPDIVDCNSATEVYKVVGLLIGRGDGG